jgi:hypothetical protein
MVLRVKAGEQGLDRQGWSSRKYAQSRRNTDRVTRSQSRVVRGDCRNGQRKGIEVEPHGADVERPVQGPPRRRFALHYSRHGGSREARPGREVVLSGVGAPDRLRVICT